MFTENGIDLSFGYESFLFPLRPKSSAGVSKQFFNTDNTAFYLQNIFGVLRIFDTHDSLASQPSLLM
jgi:hypothetical protein